MAYIKKEHLEAENVTTVTDPLISSMMFVDSDCEGPWNGHAFVCIACQESFEFGVQMFDHNAAMHAQDETENQYDHTEDSASPNLTYFSAFLQTFNNKESSEEPPLQDVKLGFLPCAFCSHTSENWSSLDRHLRYTHRDRHLLVRPRGPRGTRRKIRLRRRAASHQPWSDLLQYWCEECDEVWESAVGLKRHNWFKHRAEAGRGNEQGGGTP